MNYFFMYKALGEVIPECPTCDQPMRLDEVEDSHETPVGVLEVCVPVYRCCDEVIADARIEIMSHVCHEWLNNEDDTETVN